MNPLAPHSSAKVLEVYHSNLRRAESASLVFACCSMAQGRKLVKPGCAISEAPLHEKLRVRASAWTLSAESGKITLDLGPIGGILVTIRDANS